MIPKDIIRKVRRIQISTSRKVTDVFAGQYKSVFKGVGMEFEEVREYMPGDEIRSIDWNVTARMGHPYVKKFVEERELTIMLVLDASMSSRFGTADRIKSDLAAEFCSVIAFSAIKNSDKVGMITFTDKVERFIPARKGVKHVLRVIREALYSVPEGKGTDINMALEHLNRVMTRRAIVFLISDFISSDFRKMLSVTNKWHDVIAVRVADPSEEDLPDAGVVKLHDAETGELKVVDTSDTSTRASYRKKALKMGEMRNETFKAAKVDSIDIFTDRSYADPLVRFFRMRERRISRR
ncbi:MAG: DUF58 domain-containing protein [Candidatus Omnitrophica bacterium]|nr:DUF58 domain-containing protein [Candidatus Omnitrophota bacterium]MDD4013098.1 DUF58 domain-containing protein [Candidatus Omnitrophota bacterium]